MARCIKAAFGSEHTTNAFNIDGTVASLLNLVCGEWSTTSRRVKHYKVDPAQVLASAASSSSCSARCYEIEYMRARESPRRGLMEALADAGWYEQQHIARVVDAPSELRAT